MQSDARTLLKEATALKRAKRYAEAVAMLRRAYDASARHPLMIEERLRLPMYLQLAGRGDEGWREMNRLNVTYVDQASQISIAARMATFLHNEGNYKNASLFAVWTVCKYKELDVGTHASIVRSADARDAERGTLGIAWPRTMLATGTTPSGSPIYDVSYPAVHRRLTEDYGPVAIRAALDRDLVKVVANDAIDAVVADLSNYLAGSPPYDLVSVRTILAKYLASDNRAG